MKPGKNLRQLLVIATAFIATLLISCSKQGPQGVDGNPGPVGATGATGADGINGNTNVTAYLVNVAPASWTLSGSTYYYDANIPDISADIVSGGAVNIYMQSTTTPGVWLNMPWIEPAGSGSYFNTYNYNYSYMSARLSKSTSDLSTPVNPGARSFKVIIIASALAAHHPGISKESCSSLEAMLNLSEASYRRTK